jgi:DNA repair protein RadC
MSNKCGNSGEQLTGHRSRIKEKFMKSPQGIFADYEILEMLLFNAIPRKDTKIIAKALLDRFKCLGAVISADPVDLCSINGIGSSAIFQFKLLEDIFSRLMISTKRNEDVTVINNWEAVLNYCSFIMGFKSREHFRILFLNKRNAIISDEIIDVGTVDKVNVYPREVLKKALYHNASAIILVHNHPSGDPNPSKDDIEITKRISLILEQVHIALHDHLIVANNKHFSFRSGGLI